MNLPAKRLGVDLAATLVIALVAIAGPASAVTGGLTFKSCVGWDTNNPDSCARTAQGLSSPYGVVVSPDGKSVYAASYLGSAVVTFNRDTVTGALTAAGCIGDVDFNPTGCPTTAKGMDLLYSIAISPDGKSVYTSSGNDNAIARFRRNTTTGALTPGGCVADPDDNPDGCSKTADGLLGAFAVTVSADGKSVYAAGYSSSAIVRFDRNTTTGALTPMGCISDPASAEGCATTALGMDGPNAVTVSGDGKSVYVAGTDDNAIVRFRRNTTTGALTPLGCMADTTSNPDHCGATAKGLQYVYDIEVSPDGKSAYAAGYGSEAIVLFHRDTATGALTPRGCIGDSDNNVSGCARTVKGLGGAYAIAISRDGKSVYIVSQVDNAVVRFDRNTVTGGLTPRGCIADAQNNADGCAQTAKGIYGPQSVVISRDGKSVYVPGILDNAIAVFKRQP